MLVLIHKKVGLKSGFKWIKFQFLRVDFIQVSMNTVHFVADLMIKYA
jgi:hypothetical protein